MMNAEAPTPPDPDECCGNGCEPCIWDIYYATLRQWEQQNPKPAENSQQDS